MKDELNDEETLRVLSPYEQRIYKGYRKTPADMLTDDRMVATTVKNCLGITNEKVLDTGEVVNVPIITELTALKIKYWVSHPEKIDLKELSTVLGESKTEQVVKEINASDIFKGVELDDIEKGK